MGESIVGMMGWVKRRRQPKSRPNNSSFTHVPIYDPVAHSVLGRLNANKALPKCTIYYGNEEKIDRQRCREKGLETELCISSVSVRISSLIAGETLAPLFVEPPDRNDGRENEKQQSVECQPSGAVQCMKYRVLGGMVLQPMAARYRFDGSDVLNRRLLCRSFVRWPGGGARSRGMKRTAQMGVRPTHRHGGVNIAPRCRFLRTLFVMWNGAGHRRKTQRSNDVARSQFILSA